MVLRGRVGLRKVVVLRGPRWERDRGGRWRVSCCRNVIAANRGDKEKFVRRRELEGRPALLYGRAGFAADWSDVVRGKPPYRRRFRRQHVYTRGSVAQV